MRPARPAISRRVFIDTSAYFALLDPRDTNHQDARACWTQLVDVRRHTFTTNFVIAETHGLMLARLDHASAMAFLRQLPTSATTIVRVSARDEARGQQIIFQYGDKDFSLTDATSFAVMERLRIGAAFSYDRHFAQYGFGVLRSSAQA